MGSPRVRAKDESAQKGSQHQIVQRFNGPLAQSVVRAGRATNQRSIDFFRDGEDMRRTVAIAVGLLVVAPTFLTAQGANWKKAFEEKLKQVYVPSKVGMVDPGKVNTLGTV